MLLQKQPTVIPASGIKSETSGGFRFDINPDHTHFIIYDDLKRNRSDDNEQVESYTVFRDRVESLLTRPLNYYKKKTKKCIKQKIFFVTNIKNSYKNYIIL